MMNANQSPRSVSLAACALLLLLCAYLPCLAQQAPANTPEGSWQGTLGAGAVKLRLVLTLTKSADGGYKAVMDSVDQGATIPGDKVTLDGDKLRVEFERVNGFYEGVIAKDGKEIAGTWTQNNIAQPLSFKRRAGSASGERGGEAGGRRETLHRAGRRGRSDCAHRLSSGRQDPSCLRIAHHQLFRSEHHSCPDRGPDDSGSSLTHLDQSDLLANVLLIGNYEAAGMDKLNLAPGQMANVYIWVTLDDRPKFRPPLSTKSL